MILKHGWPFPDLKQKHIAFKLRSKLIVPIVGTVVKIVIGWCNKIEFHNRETFTQLVTSCRNRKFPLITVCNHTSCFDDPGLWAILRWRDIWRANRIRWSLAAHDVCFTNWINNWFSSSGKTIPVVRGDGVYQQALGFCLERLDEGGWVHIFPEGKVNLTLENLRLKWGVGRLVYESAVTPVVVPFYHLGMETVLPNRRPYIPRVLKRVTVVVGEPIDFSQVVSKFRRQKQVDEVSARKAITDVIQDEMNRLKVRAEELHRKRFQPT